MADYTDSKGLPPDTDGNPGNVYPQNSTVTPWGRLEPLIDAERVRTRHLFGIPLVSRMKDPTTNKPYVITDEILRDYIVRAVNEAELECMIDIMPVKYAEKQPFDLKAYDAFGYMRLQHRPVATIDRLSVMPANNQEVVVIPLDWVETANLAYGQVNIIPLQVAQNSTIGVSTSVIAPGGSVFLNILSNVPWVPSYWMVNYTTGFKDGLVPTVINDLVGTIVAMKVLSQLGATWAKSGSNSLSIDGMSQSISTPGPDVFKRRYDELQADRTLLVKKIKKTYQSKFVFGEI